MSARKYKQVADEEARNKTLVLTGYGGYDKLKIMYSARPQLKAGEVLLSIKASGINFAELMARQGTYGNNPSPPFVLGIEAGAVVLELGEGVKELQVGDRVVCASFNFNMWCEEAAVPATQCVKIPDTMSFAEAASIPVNYITAYMMLFDFGNLRPGNSVLVHMAAGGVGCATGQLCQSVKDVTVFGTASAPKHEAIKKNGITHPIDYRTKDWAEEVRKIQPEGVDIILDPLNGPDAVKGFNLLKPMGKIIHFGAANAVSGPQRSLWQLFKTWWGTKSHNPLTMIPSNKAVCGYHLGYLNKNPEISKKALADLLDLYNQGVVKPIIDSVWAFEDVDKAMSRMHDRLNVGKVILVPHKADIDAAQQKADL